MSFFLFLLVVATLFVRPAEIVAGLEEVPIYEWLILACLLTSLPLVVPLLKREALLRQPITVAVLGMLLAIFLSHASHGDFWSARYDATEFSKSVIFYLLVIANVNSTARLRLFLFWLLGCIVVCTAIAVLQFNGIINLPSLTAVKEFDENPETGFIEEISRMCSTGIFNDPNDLSTILVLGIVLAACCFFDPKLLQLKLPMAGAIALFLYALVLTKSRGGLIALFAALSTYFHTRYGLKKAILFASMFLPLALLLAKGRQADIGGAVSGGTGQARIQLWSEGLVMFRQAPLFGVGAHLYEQEAVQVAHNSYVHAFAELGFFGGALFFAPFFYSLRSLFRLSGSGAIFADRELARLRPYLLAAVAGFSASMLSLSRCYVAPTFLVLGLPAAYFNRVQVAPSPLGMRFDSKLVKDVCKASFVLLAAIYAFVRVFGRFGG